MVRNKYKDIGIAMPSAILISFWLKSCTIREIIYWFLLIDFPKEVHDFIFGLRLLDSRIVMLDYWFEVPIKLLLLFEIPCNTVGMCF